MICLKIKGIMKYIMFPGSYCVHNLFCETYRLSLQCRCFTSRNLLLQLKKNSLAKYLVSVMYSVLQT